MQSVLVFVSSTYFSNNTTVFSNFEKLHVINSSVSFFSAYELGFSALKTYPTNSIQYMLNADYRPVESTNKIIYQGHHGDSVALLANLVLPSSIFLEKISTYVNYNFLIQRTTKILPSYLNARSDWEILNFVSEVLNLTLNLSKHQDVIFLLKKISPLVNLSNFNFAVSNNKYLTKLFNYPFNSISNTYYLSDIISRASKTMALCQLKFKAKNSFSIF
jgi:predicted molibdopterin-dependent oxidoreductase YjgC